MSKKLSSKSGDTNQKNSQNHSKVAMSKSSTATKQKSMEMLPSDCNDNSDISPRIAFLSYN